jgi:hypothetical protein
MQAPVFYNIIGFLKFTGESVTIERSKAIMRILKNVPLVIDRTLKLFTERNIHATWATVGMLFCKNKKELESWVESTRSTQLIIIPICLIFLLSPGR